MVIVRLQGGLGNQLFQYAFGQYIKEFHKIDVRYDDNVGYVGRDYTPRNLDLVNLGFLVPLATSEEVLKLVTIKSRFSYRLKRKLVQLFPMLHPKYSVQGNNPHQVTADLSRDNVYYDGYWQQESLMRHVVTSVSNSLDGIQNQHNIPKSKEEKCVSIHIRRGDYVNIQSNKSIFAPCPIEYFQKAIAHMSKQIDNPVFYIFSDDLNWAKETFKQQSFKFVEGKSAIEDFLLMRSCDHHIISNSTFSWWAAFTNTDIGKIVIYPKQWYNNTRLNDSLTYFVSDKWVGL